MKKLVIALAIIAAVAVHAAEFQFPGFVCKDVALLQEQLELAPTYELKMYVSIILACAQNNPADFAAACTVIDNAITALKPDTTDQERITRKKQYAFCTGQFADELIAYCQANPNSYDIHVALRHHGTAWAKQRLMELIMQIKLTPVQAMNCISVFVAGSINGEITDENMKEILRKMDLRYTDLLSSNKEEWSPVVAKIRTLLDRYK
jgi:DNA-binding TFAR19-related protein (PDSD5 family)